MDIGRKLQQLENRLAAVERSARLSHASIDNTSLEVRDGSGRLRALLGVQTDGTTAVNVVNGPPPPQPSAPIVASVLGGITASWDGQFADGAVVPLDWARVEVHVSTSASYTPTTDTLKATIETAQGATVVIATQNPVYVQLVARNTSGAASIPSTIVGPFGPTPVVASDVLDGIITTVKLADSAVTGAKVAAGAINSNAIADAAVTAQKIGQAAVTTGKLAAGAVTINALGGPVSDLTAQRYVDAMSDQTAWQVLQSGTGAVWAFLSVPDAPTGKSVAQATGYTVVRGTVQVPYDPDALYRISARVRTTTASTSGIDSLYVGLLGVAADGVTLVSRSGANAFSSAHYVAASNTPLPTSAGWTVFTGYVRGRAAEGASGTGGQALDARTPGVMHSQVRFISPVLYLNYGSGTSGPNSGTGVMQVDAFTIESLKTGVVDSTNLVAGSVTTAALATDSVTATQILAGSVSTAKLAAGAVTTGKLAAGAVTANELAANAVTAGKILAGEVQAVHLAAGSVQTAALAADAVAAGKIAANAVTAREIAALAITSDKIAANTITAGQIQAGAVDATALKADAITGKTITGGTITGTTITGSVLQTAASGERITLNETNQNKIIVYNASGVAIGELSSRGLFLEGTTGALIWIDPSAALPQLRFDNASGTNTAYIQMAEVNPGDANLQQVTGFFTADGFTDRVWRSYMGNDFAIIERVRRSSSTANRGGRVNLRADFAEIGYMDSANAANGGYTTYQPGAVATNGRHQVQPPASSNSALEVAAATAHTGLLARLARNNVDYFTVDKDGNTNVNGMLKAASIAAGTVAVTPSAVNTPTSVTVSGLNVKGNVLRAFTGIANPSPGYLSNNTGVTGTGYTNLSSSGLTVWATRQSLTPVTVSWLIIGSDV